MSNINSLEPQAYGHIVLKTNFGELEVELFTKQCPKITRNFVQLCLDDYYRNTIFSRVEKDFIAIGGSRVDNLDEQEILKDHLEQYKDEFHSRLRFTRRGLLATANTEKNANGPEFFFTLGKTEELKEKHSIFGRLKGNSIYNLVDLNECQVDDDLQPVSEKKILDVQVIDNPFPDLEVRTEIRDFIEARTRQKDVNPEKINLGIKKNKTLSYDESDDDYDEESDIGDKNVDVKPDLKICDKRDSSEHSDLINVGKRLTSKDEPDFQPELKRPKLETNETAGGVTDDKNISREERLREVREEFDRIKRQFACDSAIKVKTLSERRAALRETSSSSEDPQQQSANTSTDSRRSGSSRRTQETIESVKTFKRKLLEFKTNSTDNASRDDEQKCPPGGKYQVQKRDVPEYLDDEDARLQAELDMIEDGAWLKHKFTEHNNNSDSIDELCALASSERLQAEKEKDDVDSSGDAGDDYDDHPETRPSKDRFSRGSPRRDTSTRNRRLPKHAASPPHSQNYNKNNNYKHHIGDGAGSSNRDNRSRHHNHDVYDDDERGNHRFHRHERHRLGRDHHRSRERR